MFAKALLAGLLVVASGTVAAKSCPITIEGNDAMAFNVKELKVAADCTEAELTLKHTGKMPASAMGHNVVITKTADYKDIAKAGGKMTLADNYVPKDDKVLASTKMIGGGQSDTVKIDLSKFKAGEDYTFFCSFPGHWSVMKGKFVFG